MEANVEDYRKNFHTGKLMGGTVMAMLAPGPGMRILDLGCGDGHLTQQIADAGADVVGVDADQAFVAAAVQLGLDARVCDGHDLGFSEEFDRVFSNAALHWMADHATVLRGVHSALRPGGQFVAECGGQGNISEIMAAMRAEFRARGLDPEAHNPWCFPSAEEFSEMLGGLGFSVRQCALVPCPVQLETDVSAWFQTFCAKWFRGISDDVAGSILAAVREAVAPELFREGRWTVNYVRLRVVAEKAAMATDGSAAES